MTFEQELERHLRAIRERDYDGLVATVGDDEIVLVTAKGEVSTDPQRFLELHSEWFASPTWTLETRVLHTREGADLATALVALDYRDDPEGVREQSVLSLVFARRGERWVMVQDQNTPVRD